MNTLMINGVEREGLRWRKRLENNLREHMYCGEVYRVEILGTIILLQAAVIGGVNLGDIVRLLNDSSEMEVVWLEKDKEFSKGLPVSRFAAISVMGRAPRIDIDCNV